MKKKILYAAVLSVMLMGSACGSQKEETETENAAAENITEDAVIENANAENNAEDTDIENTNTEDASADKADTETSETASTISIEMQPEEENSVTAEDGTLIYTSTLTYPVVTIEGNEAASSKINADILAKADAFRNDTVVQDFAEEDYSFLLENENDGYDLQFFASEESMWFDTDRSDNNVISFLIGYYSYSGGAAHGNTTYTGVNYDTRTGEVISFSSLSEDADSFHADTLAYNEALAQTDEYKERMYPDDLSGDIETVLYAEDKWYLSPEGLVFISDPYALGPYVSGMIAFLIPYDDLEEMGFQAEYAIPAP